MHQSNQGEAQVVSENSVGLTASSSTQIAYFIYIESIRCPAAAIQRLTNISNLWPGRQIDSRDRHFVSQSATLIVFFGAQIRSNVKGKVRKFGMGWQVFN